jgi:SAM-dependent methyltransferase
MSIELGYKDFGFQSAAASHMNRHFLPPLLELAGELKPGTRVLDVGCGNGFTAGVLLSKGCKVTGIDLSEKGISIAKQAYPDGDFHLLPADGDLLNKLNCEPFDLVISTEVVEHVYAPRDYAAGVFKAVKPGGKFICTTPYHGYLKNLLISLAGKWDHHADPLWDGGHIKLWSRAKLSALLTEVGFVDLQFRGAGRLPWVWMTMVMSAERPKNV